MGEVERRGRWAEEPPSSLEVYALGRGLEDFVVLTFRVEPAERSRLLATLTIAEREVAEGILEGIGNAAIARRRGVALRTVANQVASLFRKVRVSSRAELVRKLLTAGIR